MTLDDIIQWPPERERKRKGKSNENEKMMKSNQGRGFARIDKFLNAMAPRCPAWNPVRPERPSRSPVTHRPIKRKLADGWATLAHSDGLIDAERVGAAR